MESTEEHQGSTAVALQLPGLDLPAAARATATGLTPGCTLTVDQAVTALAGLRRIGAAWKWIVGDVVLAAARNGDVSDVLQAIAELDIDDAAALSRYVALAEAIPARVRRERLSWSHHAAVAGMAEAEQEHWLGRAEACGWSVAVLRERLAAELDPEPDQEPQGQLLPRVSRRTLTAVATAVEDLWAAEASPSPVTVILLPDDSWRLGGEPGGAR